MPDKSALWCGSSIFALFLLCVPLTAWAQLLVNADIEDVGDPAATRSYFSSDLWHRVISADGSHVIGINTTPGGDDRAFLWTLDGGQQLLGTLGGDDSFARSVTPDGGTVIGESRLPSAVLQAFIWTESGGMIGLGGLGPTLGSSAEAVSSDGSTVVGTSHTGVRNEAFIWTQAGGMVGLGTLGGNYSYALGVSADGSIVAGESTTGGASRIFRWTQAGGMVNLGSLGGYALFRGMTDDGSVIIGESNDLSFDTQAFRWTQAGGLVSLGFIGAGDFSTAYGMNADGSVVVGGADDGSLYQGFRWTQAGGMVGLGVLPGGGFSEAYKTSADGSVILGLGEDSVGDYKVVIWTEERGMNAIDSLLADAGVDLTGWVFDTYDADISADGKVIVGEAELNGRDTIFITNLLGITTPEELFSSLLSMSAMQSQAQAASGQSLDYGLLAARHASANFVQSPDSKSSASTVVSQSNAAPQDIEPAAGDSVPAVPRLPASGPTMAAYGFGNFGIMHGAEDENWSSGGTTGLLFRVGNNTVIGVGVTGTVADSTLIYNGSSTLKSAGVSTLFAREDASGWRLFGSAVVNYLSFDNSRNYLNGASIDGSSGDTDGVAFGTAIRAGRQFDVTDHVQVMPYAGVHVSHVTIDGYAETGGAFPASFDDQDSTDVAALLGVELSQRISESLQVQGRIAVGHHVLQEGSGLNVDVLGSEQSLPFQTTDRAWAEGGLTTVYKMTPSAMLIADIAARTSETNMPNVQITLGVNYAFQP